MTAKVSRKKEYVELYEPMLNKWIAVSVSPIFDQSGEIVKLIHVIHDITERKLAEQRLKELMDIKSEFISMVSHELRTPLTAIKEGINIVLDGSSGPVNDDQKNFLNLAKRNLDRLARLINDVLDFQKLESGKVQFNIQINDINIIVKEVCETMSSLAQKKGLGIGVKLDEGLPQVKFDRDKITEVLTNIISNAIKYTTHGNIMVTTRRNTDSIQVSVQDNGPGINSDDLPRLFRQFEQLETGVKRKPGSSGLGLAISKQIIDKHNGKIWADSQIGKGSVFSFILPIA